MAVRGGGRRGPISRDDVLGMLSLIFWALIIVVTVKYVLIVLRADNHGEGGMLALMALRRRRALGRRTALICHARHRRRRAVLRRRMITPAISVLSAVEGLEGRDAGASSTTSCRLTVAILIVLFVVQSRGTARSRPVRAGDGGVVRDASRVLGLCRIVATIRGAAGDQSALRRRASSPSTATSAWSRSARSSWR